MELGYFKAAAHLCLSLLQEQPELAKGRLSDVIIAMFAACFINFAGSYTLGEPPHPVIVTIRDSKDYIRVLLYCYSTTITGWGGGGPPSLYLVAIHCRLRIDL